VIKKSALFSAVAGEMKKLGFKRWKSNYEYVIDLGPGFEGYCSFADSTHREKTAVWIATFAGIRCEAIESRIAAWCGDVIPGWDGSYVPTVSANIGYFTERVEWLEHRVDLTGDSIEDGIRPSISDVTEVGLGFMRSHASYPGLIEALEFGRGQLTERRLERTPLAYALAQNLEGAYRELEEMKRMVDEGSLMAVRYLRFIEGFESEFRL